MMDSFSVFNNKNDNSSPASTTVLSWPETPNAHADSRRILTPPKDVQSTDAARDRRSVNDAPRSESSSGSRRQTHAPSGQPADNAAGNVANDEDDNDDVTPNIIMTLMFASAQVSAAAYDMDTGILYGIADQVEFDDFRSLRKIIGQVAPTRIIVTSTVSQRLIDALNDIGVVDQHQCPSDQENEGPSPSSVMSTLSLPEWDFKVCLSRLLTLPVFKGVGDSNDRESRLVRLDALLSLDNKLLIRSLGALLGFLFKNRAGGIMLDTEGGLGVFVADLQLIKLDQIMGIDRNTFNALRIFKRVNHPSSSLKSAVVKDSDSLFFLANSCKSKPGSSLLRSWFLRPSADVEEIRRRHQSVAFFKSYFSSLADARVKELKRHLSRVSSLTHVILKMASSTPATHRDWLRLTRTVIGCLRVAELLSDIEQHLDGGKGKSSGRRGNGAKELEGLVDMLTTLRRAASEDAEHVAQTLTNVLDIETTEELKKIVIRCGVDERLDELNGILQQWPEYLDRMVRRQIQSLPTFISGGEIKFLNQIGFMLQIARGDCHDRDGDLKDADVEILFTHDDFCFCKTAIMKTLDKEYEAVIEAVENRERDILRHLQQFVVAESPVISKLVTEVARVDAILSLANFAHNFSLTKPELAEDSNHSLHSIEFKDSRHVLQETFVEGPYVPNDYASGGTTTKIKILTGPNASGKSVYLCQIALAVFLCQLGSFVPATHARLSVVDQIFTRINSDESISACTSSWGCDLAQVSLMLKEATGSSLVILDEFGKGTDPTSGCCLLAAVVNHWSRASATERPDAQQPQQRTPHVLVATHFHEITRRTPDGQRGVLLTNLETLTFLVMDFIGEEDCENRVASGSSMIGSLARDSSNISDDAFVVPRRRGSRKATSSGANLDAQKQRLRSDASDAASSSSEASSMGSSAVKNIIYLYRVVEGRHPFSYAFQIAKGVDLDDAVIDRAIRVLGAMTGGEPLDPFETEVSKTKLKNKRKLLREIFARRKEMSDRDIEELRDLVRELDLSSTLSGAITDITTGTGSSRFESTNVE